MSHKKKQAQGSQQTGQRDGNQSQKEDPDGNRRDQGNQGNQGERNSSSSGGGISNRGMDSEEEQEDLPIRGSEREPGDSER